MIDISKISSHYSIRILSVSDIDAILKIYKQNTLFYSYTSSQPTREQVISDMTITPRGIEPSDKYFLGFIENNELVAIMDLVDGYPKPGIIFIGLFMMNQKYQGKGIGTEIISETADYLRMLGKTTVRLAIDKGNPQSAHFWKKNGFDVINEVEINGWTKLIAEKVL